jgi:hypothetical protein
LEADRPPRNRDKLGDALRDGHLWRAKEILAGRVGSGPFNSEIYEHLGKLLLRMGDDLQAGRYLFLSGQRRPEYRRAIDLFVARHSRAGWQSLVAQFPSPAKRCSWSDLPNQVREELRAMGVPARAEGQVLSQTLRSYPAGRPGWMGCLLIVLGLVAIGMAIAWIIAYFYDSQQALAADSGCCDHESPRL